MQEAVIEVLRAVGIYGQVREMVGSDRELVSMFLDDFEGLAERVQNGAAASELGKRPEERR